MGKYRGIANCGATIVRQEGVEALWKGVVPFTTHLMCKYAMRMGKYTAQLLTEQPPPARRH